MRDSFSLDSYYYLYMHVLLVLKRSWMITLEWKLRHEEPRWLRLYPLKITIHSVLSIFPSLCISLYHPPFLSFFMSGSMGLPSTCRQSVPVFSSVQDWRLCMFSKSALGGVSFSGFFVLFFTHYAYIWKSARYEITKSPYLNKTGMTDLMDEMIKFCT